MQDLFEPYLGPNGALIAEIAVWSVVVLAVLLIVWWVAARSGRFGRGSLSRGRVPRLAIVDALVLDQRRRLVLIRRDNLEHLILIGGAGDIVVESGIRRQKPATQPAAEKRGGDTAQTIALPPAPPQTAIPGASGVVPAIPVVAARPTPMEPEPELPEMPVQPMSELPEREAGEEPIATAAEGEIPSPVHRAPIMPAPMTPADFAALMDTSAEGGSAPPVEPTAPMVDPFPETDPRVEPEGYGPPPTESAPPEPAPAEPPRSGVLPFEPQFEPEAYGPPPSEAAPVEDTPAGPLPVETEPVETAEAMPPGPAEPTATPDDLVTAAEGHHPAGFADDDPAARSQAEAAGAPTEEAALDATPVDAAPAGEPADAHAPAGPAPAVAPTSDSQPMAAPDEAAPARSESAPDDDDRVSELRREMARLLGEPEGDDR